MEKGENRHENKGGYEEREKDGGRKMGRKKVGVRKRRKGMREMRKMEERKWGTRNYLIELFFFLSTELRGTLKSFPNNHLILLFLYKVIGVTLTFHQPLPD